MSKREAEGLVGKALRSMDLACYVFKPSDRDVNPKPADFFVWLRGRRPAWVEAKDDGIDHPTLNAMRLLEPSQFRGVTDAIRSGTTYLLVVWIRRRARWVILDASLMQREGAIAKRWKYEELNRWGTTEVRTADLSSTLRLVLLGEL